MSEDVDPSSDVLPESNADAVASKLVFESMDLDGVDLVKILRLLLSQAEQIKATNERLGNLEKPMMSGSLAQQEEINRELLHGLFEPISLKWFLARSLAVLSERLAFEVSEKQQHLRPIRSIVYTNDGDVESFSLDSSDPPQR